MTMALEIENKALTRGNPAWMPGAPSPNPGGRPRGLAALVREQTGDGLELVAFMLTIFRGKRKGASLKLRMEAAAWLADRGFGKATQLLEMSGPEQEPLVIRIEYPETIIEGDEG